MTGNILFQNLDYIFYVYGFLFLVIAMVADAVHRTCPRCLPWNYLSYYAALQCLRLWAEMFTFSYGERDALEFAGLILLAASYMMLLEFSRRSLAALNILRAGKWVLLVPPCAVLAAYGLGLGSLEVLIKLLITFPAGLLASAALWRHGGESAHPGGRMLRLTAAAMLLNLLNKVLLTPPTDFVFYFYGMQFQEMTGIPAQLISAASVAAAAAALALHFLMMRRHMLSAFPGLGFKDSSYHLFLSLIFLTLLLGWAATEFVGKYSLSNEMEQHLMRAKMVTAALNHDRIVRLTGTADDLASEDYVRLREQCTSIGNTNPSIRYICMLGLRDGKVFFYFDTEPDRYSAIKDRTPLAQPGQIYEDAAAVFYEIFRTRKPTTLGPYNDIWGTFISALVPADPAADAELRHVVCVDILVDSLQYDIKRARLIPILTTMLLSVALLLSLGWRLKSDDMLMTLAESEMKYRQLYENAFEAIVSTDMGGRFINCNPAYERMLGYPLDELKKLSYQQLTPEKWHAMEDDIVTGRVLKFGYSGVYEKEYIRKDGTVFPVELSTFLIRDKAGNPLSMWAFCRDLTDRKRIEEEKDRLQEQVFHLQKIETLGRMAGGVAHDFNNLLTPIMGYAQMGLWELKPDDPLYKQLKEILDATRRARDLVKQLLSFARKEIVQLKAIDLRESISGFKPLLQKTLRKNIALEVKLPASLDTVMANEPHIEQILMNLAINSQDAMPDGGRFTISVENADVDEDFAKNNPQFKPGRHVMIRVSDSGCGMDEETLKHVFEPFFTTKRQPNTGLGLSTVYGIVKQRDGAILVRSEKGKGTVFEIYFPSLQKDSDQRVTQGDEKNSGLEPPPSTAKASGPEDVPRKTVIVVDDDKNVLKTAVEMLERCGYKVASASSAEECLKLPDRILDAADVLLTDVILPDLDGKELSNILRKEYPGLKVVFMSGFTGGIIDTKILRSGDLFIQKPFSFQELKEKIDGVLS